MAGLKNYIISFILYIELISLCQATSKNVTKEIFGDELNYLPVAFAFEAANKTPGPAGANLAFSS